MIGNTKYAGRDLYAVEGLKYMPKLLSMVDQNPTSPTYGCGDRQYWLYKQIDFPSGMYGEFALPLALTYRYPHPSNPYYREPKIRQLALAVIRFQDRMSHRDGSADDFFPFERALGATAFSLYAMAEASHVLGVTDDDILAFIVRRAEWLARSSETGQLSNHHALAALGLAVANQLTGEPLFKHASLEFRDRVIKWQSDEGWFPEYDGFDPGYDTFTISFLAYLRLKMADDTLTEPLKRAVQLAANLVGPDGSYGGEIGSRNSYHYLPHGFELLASEFESALYMADQFLMSLENDRRSSLDENRTFCHYQYNYLQSWHDFADRNMGFDWQPDYGLHHYPSAGLISISKPTYHVLISYRKGGIIKASNINGPIVSDTGLVLVDQKGGVGAPAIGRTSDFSIDCAKKEMTIIVVKTKYSKIMNTVLPTPIKFILFRLLNITLGRFVRDWIRRVIQYFLITRQISFPFSLERQININQESISVTDQITATSNGKRIDKIFASSDLTTKYTASSNSWHQSRKFPWVEEPDAVMALNEHRKAIIKREWKIFGRQGK